MEVLLQSCFPLALLLTTPLPSTLQPNMASFSEAPYTIPDSTLNCVEQPLHSLTSSTYFFPQKMTTLVSFKVSVEECHSPTSLHRQGVNQSANPATNMFAACWGVSL